MANNEDGSNGKSKDVQYFDSDFSFEEHAEEVQQQWGKAGGDEVRDVDGDGTSESATSASATAAITEDDDDLLPQSQSKFWDAFHSNHSAGNFYKPRRYLIKSFPCILQYFETGYTNTSSDGDYGEQNNNTPQAKEDRIVLEIGCGSGSSCIPLLKQCSSEKEGTDEENASIKRILLACDSSPVAVQTTQNFIEKFSEKDDTLRNTKIRFGAFVADPGLSEEESTSSFLQRVKSAYEDLKCEGESEQESNNVGSSTDGIAGIVLMVFVLSAVTPTRVHRFLEQVHQATKPGGMVCFRDYGKCEVLKTFECALSLL